MQNHPSLFPKSPTTRWLQGLQKDVDELKKAKESFEHAFTGLDERVETMEKREAVRNGTDEKDA